MPEVLLRHRVADYDAWRPFYDDDRPRREEAGLRDLAVYRDADDPDMVLLLWEADGLDALRGMLASEDLGAIMRKAGVISEPEVWVAEPLD